jgi:hypothetical protein
MAKLDHPAEFRIRDYLQECDAAALLRGASLRFNEELSLLQANALSAQETIDGFISAADAAASSTDLAASHAALSTEVRTAFLSKSVAIEAALVRIDAALEHVEELNNEAVAAPDLGDAPPKTLRVGRAGLFTGSGRGCSKTRRHS